MEKQKGLPVKVGWEKWQFALYVILLFSGISALIYQVIWIRKFAQVFGIHAYSMATVLAAFMGGLALGSILFGSMADRIKNPLRLFAFLELGIGLFAVFFPVLFKGLISLYTAIGANTDIHEYRLQLIRFFFAFFFLLIPTTLMGGTLPVIIKYFVHRLGEVGQKVSGLYAVNNLGAVLGGFIAGFIIIRLFGVIASLYIAAAFNLFNAVTALVFSKKMVYQEMAEEEVTEQDPILRKTSSERIVYALPRSVVRLVLWVFAIEGFTTLAYEVIWARILIDFSFDKTVYFTSTIVISFIFGLSLGSFLINKWIDRMKNLLSLLGCIEILIGLVTVALIFLFAFIAPRVSHSLSLIDTWMQTAGKEYIIFFVMLSLPTTLMGFTYPIVSKLYNDNIRHLGKGMGVIGFMDTVGSIIGSFVAGFILIPVMGVVHSLLLVVYINVFIGLLIILFHPVLSAKRKTIVTISSVFVVALMTILMPSRYYFTWWDQLDYKKTFFGQHYDKIIFYDEGVGSTVTVRHYPYDEDYLALNINGHNSAYTTRKDRRVNGLLGYLPYLLVESPENALVIGYGMGVTAHSLMQPGMKTVDIAEISPGVIKASPSFAPWNKNVLKDPRTHVHIEDGRSFLLMSRKKYDIITTNAIHPRLSNNIYTKDFYGICRDKLTDDGIVCQWIPQNWLNTREFKSLIRAFVEVFPQSQMWYINEYSTLLVGKKHPFKINYTLVESRYDQNDLLRDELSDVGLSNPASLLAQYFYSPEDLRDFIKNAPVDEDNYPLVEFSRVVNIAPDTVVMRMIRDHPTNFYGALVHLPADSLRRREIMKSIKINQKMLRERINSIIVNVMVFVENTKKKKEKEK